jgi:ABC-type polysaccharide/polyol phosphate transport system ATPase subunit
VASHGGDDVTSPVIEVLDASVSYMIRHGAASTLKETAIQALKRQSHDVEVKALQNLSFRLNAGEVLAVIGRNGAGKSTLLKLVARVLPPTTGRVIVRGSVSPMIELGAGFNSELTGLENIVLYGTLLGRSPKEMRKRSEAIATWAGLEKSINLPLRTYSSGMVARLAFAIATDVVSDLILIDEVLSVGDAEFQKKSNHRMNELINSKSAVVLVTHNLDTAREMAHKALWIDHGRAMKYGEVNSVIDAYLNA